MIPLELICMSDVKGPRGFCKLYLLKRLFLLSFLGTLIKNMSRLYYLKFLLRVLYIDFSAAGASGHFFAYFTDLFYHSCGFKYLSDLLLVNKIIRLLSRPFHFLSPSHFKLNVSLTELNPSCFQNSFLGQ